MVQICQIIPAHIRRKNLGEKHFNEVNSFHVNCRCSFSNDFRLISLIRLFKVNKVNTSMANARLNGLALAYIHKPTEIDLFRLYILFSQYRSCDDTQEI